MNDQVTDCKVYEEKESILYKEVQARTCSVIQYKLDSYFMLSSEQYRACVEYTLQVEVYGSISSK